MQTGAPEIKVPKKPTITENTSRDTTTPSRDTGHLYVGPHTKGHYISSAHFALISQEASRREKDLAKLPT